MRPVKAFYLLDDERCPIEEDWIPLNPDQSGCPAEPGI